MDWKTSFEKDNAPALEQIAAYIASPLWAALRAHLEETYGVQPIVQYSCCTGAPGWNVKYRKSSRALCTLYPAAGKFTCMVAVGAKEAMEAELLLTVCTEYLRTLYWQTKPFNGARWMMVEVTTPEILEDVKRLISLRVRPGKRSEKR